MRYVILLLLASALMPVEAAEYVIVPAEGSRFVLYVEKTGLWKGRKHEFVFERYEGKATESSVRLSVETLSAKLTDQWVSEKDKRKVLEFTHKEMLDSARHPKIEFASDNIERAGENRYRARGTLTVRGIAKPAVVDVKVAEKGEGFQWLEGGATIKMSDYGLKPPSAALGTIGTKDEMRVEFRILLKAQSVISRTLAERAS